jgi:hypothetical protein
VKWIVVITLVALVVGYHESQAQGPACQYGRAQAFITVKNDPEYLVGTIPNMLTGSKRFLQRIYNCKGRGAQIRRVDLGTYEVRFPGLHRRSGVVSVVSQEGVSSSVQPFGRDTYRVALRGPTLINGVLSRRDVAFTLVVF